jgi:hypothetical protein
MHRQIVQATPDQVVHHINHNTLDNRRSNLQLLTPSEHRWLQTADALLRIDELKTGGTPRSQITTI